MPTSQIPPNTVALSHCAAKYAVAISDPWNPEAQGCCIPTFPSKASQKSTAWVRSTVTIGTAGFGFVAISPCLANNQSAIYTSSASYVASNIGINSANITSGAVLTASLNTPWTSTQLTSGASSSPPPVSGRIVSAGLSIQYTGTVFSQGGESYSLVEPNHGNINGMGTAALGAYQECVVTRVDSKKLWLATAGIDAQEVQYPANYEEATASLQPVYPFSQGQTLDSSLVNSGAVIMGFLIQGPANNTFQVEYVQHMEFIGANTSTMATPTHSDARGFEMVNTASNRLAQLKVSHPTQSLPKLMNHALAEVAHEIAPYARAGVKMIGAAGLTAFGNAIAGPMGGMMGGSALRIMGG